MLEAVGHIKDAVSRITQPGVGEQVVVTRNRGSGKAGSQAILNPGVAAWWSWQGHVYAVPCDRWFLASHNAESIARALLALLAADHHGVRICRAALQGFRSNPALAAVDPVPPWEDASTSRTEYVWANSRDAGWGWDNARESVFESSRRAFREEAERHRRAQEAEAIRQAFAERKARFRQHEPPKPPQPLDFDRRLAAATSMQELRTLYAQAAKEVHPDLNPGTSGDAMAELNGALRRAKTRFPGPGRT